MTHILARHSPHAAAATLRRVLSWPARVAQARRTMAQLARMSDVEMRDIGLVRQDVVDENALRLDVDPRAPLGRRRAARQRPAPGRAETSPRGVQDACGLRKAS